MNKQKLIILSFVLFVACLLFADPPDWTPMIGNQYNMQVYAEVTLFEQPFTNENPGNILAAFGPGGEQDCRAIAFWDQVGPYAMWYLTIRSNASAIEMEPINFLIYDAAADQIYDTVGEFQIYFADNSVIGSIYDPYQLSAPANLPPVAVTDLYQTDEDIYLQVDALQGVLSNDYDPEGLELTAVLVDQTQHGSLEFFTDGSFNYLPGFDYYGADMFSYQAFDGVLYSDITIVNITINPVNDPPRFQFPPLGFSFNEDEDLIENFSNWISDPENDPIINLTASVTNYIILDIAGMVVQFTAPLNWFGEETVTFTATDSNGDSASEDVLVTVISVNDPPVIDIPYDQFTMEEDDVQILDLSLFISDIDNQELLLSVFDNDNISVSVDGFSVTLIPNENWFGSETLNFVVSDDVTRLTDNDFVEIIVQPVNDPPVINIPEDEYTFLEDESLLLDLSEYISDVDDTMLDITYSGYEYLIFEDLSPTVFYITAPLNWFGSELITFTVIDTAGLEASDDVLITVIPVPDPPVIMLPDSFTLEEDSLLIVDFGLEGYVYDVDSEILSLSSNGSNVVVNITGLNVEFIPLPDWNGTETITFTVYDETLQAQDDVDIIVTPVNDAPLIDIEDSYSFQEDEILQVDFSQYITDVDLDELTLTAAGNMNILVDIELLQVSFSAVQDWFGSEIITFTVNDNQGRAIASDSTEVIVTPANDEPVFILPNEISLYEDINLTVDFAQYITDDSSFLALSAGPAVNLMINIDSLLVTFIPNSNWNGVENISFTVFDGEFYVPDDVLINVIPVNDPPQINVPLEFVFNPNQVYNYNFQNFVFDLDSSTLSLSVTGNQNIDISISNLMVTFTTGDWLGVETVIFTVDDGTARATAFDQMDLIVTDDTLMPVIYLPVSFTFNEDSARSIDFNPYIYNDSQIQVYLSASGNENVIVEIDTLTNFVNLSALPNWFGTEEITFTIHAPGYDYYNSDQTNVIVNPVNDAPIINLPVGGFSFLEDASLTVDFNLGEGYISDVDNETVFMDLIANSPMPNIMVNFTGNIAYFTALPDYNGAETFTIYVNDGIAYVQQVFTVTVIPVNDAPVIDLPGAGFTFPENETLLVNFDQYIFDVDMDNCLLSLVNETDYIFAQINGTMVSFSSITYWNGSEALVFSVNDLHGRAIDIDTVMVYVSPVNNPPYIAYPMPDLQIMENQSNSSINLNIVFADYDTDPDLNAVVSDSLFFSSFEPGESNFNITITDGLVTIAPVQNWFGSKTLYFIATDTMGLTAQDSTLVTVISVNYPPEVILSLPDYNKQEDFTDFSLDLDLYFDDQDGDVLTYTVQYDPEQVFAQVLSSTLIISSLPNWYGQAGIIITATDPDELSANDGFVINVIPVNDPPQIALPPDFNLQEDIESVFNFASYASDPDNNSLIIFNDNPENLVITYGITAPLEVHIISNINWFGSELVTFYVSDQTGRLVDSDSVLVNVAPVNDPPVINVPNEGFTFAEDGSLVVDFTPYVSDVDSQFLSVIVSDGVNVQAAVAGYQVTFTAIPNWFGTENNTFTVGDGQYYDSEIAPVIVTPVNDPPVINLPISFTTPEDTPLVVDFAGYISDIDNLVTQLSLSVVGTYPDVNVSIAGTQVTFTPGPNFNGTVNISFLVNDNSGGITSDDVNLIVSPVNDPPTIILPASFTFNEDATLPVDFTAYVNDVDGNPLTLSVQNNVNVTVNITGLMVSFGAVQNWNGTENLTFIVNDGQGATANDNVNVIVNPVGDAPTINLPPEFRFDEDNSSEINFIPFITDIDTPFDQLALQVSGNTNVIVNFDMLQVNLSAVPNWNGTELLTFTVYETVGGLSASDDVNITVRPINDAPTINLPLSVNINEGGSLVIDMSDFIDDIDNNYNDLTLTCDGTDHLTVQIDNLVVTLLAETDWVGNETIQFTVYDLTLSNTDNMRVYILPTNDPPVIILPDQFVLQEDVLQTLNFALYASDVDGDPLTLTASGNEFIQVYIQGLAVTLIGNLNWNGEEVIYFTVDDNVNRLTATDSVLVVVEPVNDPPVINIPPSIIAVQGQQESYDLSSFIYSNDGDSLTLTAGGYELIDDILIDGFVVTFVDSTWDVNENVFFYVTDGTLISTDIVNVTLIPVDHTPDPGDVVITLPFLDGLEPGEEFLLPVNVNILLEYWEVYGFEFWLFFDPELLEFLGFNFEGTIGDTTRVVAGEREIFIDHDFTNPLFGSGSLINIEFKYISNEYEQAVVELDDFEFHSPTPFYPVVLPGTINNDYPSLILPLLDASLEEDFSIYSVDLANHFYDNSPQSDLEFSVSSASQDFAVTIDNSMMNIVSIPDRYTTQTWPVYVVCYDRFHYSVRDTFLVYVDPINDPPRISIENDFQMVSDGTLHVDFTNYITDVDNDVGTEVTISVENISTGIDPDDLIDMVLDGKIADFTAPHNWTGINNYEIIAYDPLDSSQALFNILVVYTGGFDVHCYPNPMNTDDGTRFVINSTASLAGIEISIYDFAGKEVCSESFAGRGSNEITWMGYTDGWNGTTNGTKLARGVYFARVVGKDGFDEIALEKVIKVVIKD
ncbi:MAG: tandem-95 repeat protein [Candidatus Cloacimonetes bacterium]|nr:tandem-95 repeat protein [Candidatus Cloacimonadota bacterium]